MHAHGLSSIVRLFLRTVIGMVMLGLLPIAAHAASVPSCQQQASDDCYFSFQPAPGSGQLHYYASQSAEAAAGPTGPRSALIVIHGHPRDANITFNAALAASSLADTRKNTVIIAPVFQVSPDEASKCSTAGVPTAQTGDLLWTCASWLDGGEADNARGITSFTALDALVVEVTRRWPTVRVVTIAGFSAGAQMVQHYIGFAAADVSSKIAIRYVVADPGTWLYFDGVRPIAEGDTTNESTCADASCRFHLAPPTNTCPNVNQWKYGTDGLPASLKRTASVARAHYVSADIFYLEAAQDSGTGRGTYSHILDKSCAAEAQGSFRLQRGLAYAAYDRQLLAPNKHRAVVVIPDCAHDVTCVFTSPTARAALFSPSH